MENVVITKGFCCGYTGCNKRYSLKQHLVRHTQVKHESRVSRADFPCEECPETFKTKQNLQKHIHRKHNEKLPFKCTMCTRTFKRSTLLAHHLFLHTGEKLLNCDYCNRAFSNQTDRYRHEAKHKTFVCVCERKFHSWAEYNAHRKTEHLHGVFHCDICKKIFTNRAYIVRHMKIHIDGDEKPTYPCPQCSKTYTTFSNLKHHIKSVHLRLTYDCVYPECDAKLSTQDKLDRHYVKHFQPKVEVVRKKSTKRRKDFGEMKRSIAAQLSGALVTLKTGEVILDDANKSEC